MESFIQEIQVRWSDLDPNGHLRHSIYYDWAALSRIQFLYRFGMTTQQMQQAHFGPILFREECLFRKEIHLGDRVTIDLSLSSARKDFSRWSILHTIKKNEDTVAAIITVEGAWIDTVKRKLTTPPAIAAEVFGQMPRLPEFQWKD